MTIHTGDDGRVTKIDGILGQPAINYVYSGGRLVSATDQKEASTRYSYEASGQPGLLTQVIDARNVPTLRAAYDAAEHVSMLFNVKGKTIPVTTAALGTGRIAQTVVDTVGNVTQQVFDEAHGLPVRTIRRVPDSSGAGFYNVVTVTGYDFVINDIAIMSDERPSGVEFLRSIRTYEPFEVSGANADLSFWQSPPVESWTTQVVYDNSEQPEQALFGTRQSASQRVDDAGRLLTTRYSDYKVVNSVLDVVKPQRVTVEYQVPRGQAETGYDTTVKSTRYIKYDYNEATGSGSGEALYDLTPVARDVPGGGLADTTLAGGYMAAQYLDLQNLYGGAKGNRLAWNPSTHAYEWNYQDDTGYSSFRIIDNAAVGRGGGATPIKGDVWSIKFEDSDALGGDGLAGELGGLSFDGTPGQLKICIDALRSSGEFENVAESEVLEDYTAPVISVPGWLAEGTGNVLTQGGDTPDGLVADSYRIASTIPANGTLPTSVSSLTNAETIRTASNSYYGENDYSVNQNGVYVPNAGAHYGSVERTRDAAGQETVYGYDAGGRLVLQYAYKKWTDKTGADVRGWVGTTNQYDSAGRLQRTDAATYLASVANLATATNADDLTTFNHTLAMMADGDSVKVVDTGTSPDGGHDEYVAPRAVKQTSYDSVGRVAATAAEYVVGDFATLVGSNSSVLTRHTYDANGNVIRTQNPDGTESRTVYDDLNRPIWQTGDFVLDANGANPGPSTKTTYDALGNAVLQEIFTGTKISVSPAPLGSATVNIATLVDAGTGVSATRTYYDDANRPIETVDPGGLHTGTTYTPDGQVEYSGPLTPYAIEHYPGGHGITVSGVTVRGFIFEDFDHPSHNQPLLFDVDKQQFFSRATDANENATDTYTDAIDRPIRTVYADETYTETLYGHGSQPVLVDQERQPLLKREANRPAPQAIMPPEDSTTTVQIGRRRLPEGDEESTAPLATFNVTDAAGRLTDVYLPQVIDGDSAHTGSTNEAANTFGHLVVPHWQYAYDNAGNQLNQVSPTSKTNTYAYDQNNNKVRQQLPGGELKVWTYDEHDNQKSRKDYAANATAAMRTVLYEYEDDAAHGGRLDSVSRYGADVANLSSPPTPDELTNYVYDDNAGVPSTERTGLGRTVDVIDKVKSGSTLVTRTSSHTTYDSLTGNETSITTPEGTIHYVYDPETGRKIEMWTGTTHAAAQNDVLYGYDRLGRLASITSVRLNNQMPSAIGGGIRYDASGHEIATTSPTVLYGYDPADNLKTVSRPNGDQTRYDYDTQARVTDVTIAHVPSETPLFKEHAEYEADGPKSSVTTTRYDADGTPMPETETTWAYDADDRLTRETYGLKEYEEVGGEDQGRGTGGDEEEEEEGGDEGDENGDTAPTPYTDTFAYDLDNNRTEKRTNGGALDENGDPIEGGVTVVSEYNANDQLKTETTTMADDPSTAKTYGYDPEGNLISVTPGGSSPTNYGYDLRDRMTSVTSHSQTTTYGYDPDSTLAGTVGPLGTAYSLNDPLNPTGYAKAVQTATSSAANAVPTLSSVLGLFIEAQADASGTRWLLVDGHTSTRALADGSGQVIVGQTFDYDAFGTPLTDADAARTAWLYGGDGVFDRTSGLTNHLARWRDGFRFTSQDKMPGGSDDLTGLNRYDYAGMNPVAGSDPSGYFSILDPLASTGEMAGEYGEAGEMISAGVSLKDQIKGMATLFEATQSGFINMALSGPKIDPAASFAVGFASGLISTGLYYFAGVPCGVSNGVGAAINDAGNDYLAKGSLSAGDLGQAIAVGVITGLLFGCFVGGTPVLMADGSTQAIDTIHIGERVTTDGGVANSEDGKTRAADPSATAVDSKTWRKVTIGAGDWEVEALEPESWLTTQQLSVHSTLDLGGIIDLAEMGAPEGLIGTIESIQACPTIEDGPGRVVTTTVSHLNADVYDLTLKDANGDTDTLGVTGVHRFYDEGKGWVHARDLYEGETLRTDAGTVTVRSNVRDAGTFRVYNMTVEGDHVYYVGDLTTLTHNACSGTSGENIAASNGRAMHEAFSSLAKVQEYIVKTALKNGLIPDAFRISKDGMSAIVRELKPGNARAVARGLRQLDAYAAQIAKQFGIALKDISKILETY